MFENLEATVFSVRGERPSLPGNKFGCRYRSEVTEPHTDARVSLPKGEDNDEFSKGDHVSWNSEAGHVSGRIVKVHEQDFEYKDHRRRASKEAPQYEIESDKTDHIAAHKEDALKKID